MAMRAAAAAAATASVARASSSPPPAKPIAVRAPPQPPRPSPALLAPAVSLLSLLATPSKLCEARAFSFPKEEILSSLNKVEGTVEQAQKVLDSSFSAASALLDALKPTVEVAAPVMQKAGEEALKIASPIVSEASKQAQDALQNAGLNISPVVSAAKIVAQQSTNTIEVAKPVASAAYETLSSSDPALIVGSVGALGLAYLLFPSVLSAVSFSIRGYKGNMSAAQALDLVTTQNYVLIDVRSEKDKNKAGIPRLPSNARNKIISIPLEELPNKVKGLVRDTKKVEAEMSALKISYLKRVNKGSNIVIMDSYSDMAKIVARTLTAFGFKNVWVVTDGFSGGRGWLQSRLGTDSYNVAIAELLSPSRVIPAVAGRFGTTSSRSRQSTQRLLPGSIDN